MMNLVFVLAVYSFSTGSFFHLVFGLLCTVKNLLPKRNKEAHMLFFFFWLSEKASGISQGYFRLHIFSASAFVPITLEYLLATDPACHCCPTSSFRFTNYLLFF